MRLPTNLRNRPKTDPLHCRRCFSTAKPGERFRGVDRPCRTHCEQDILVSYVATFGTTRQQEVSA